MADPIGSFQVLGTLGKGAHSSILHVRRTRDGKQYALKIVPIDSKEEIKFLDQARHEFRVAQMLGHPNIAKIHSLEFERTWLFRVRKAHMLIEFVNGKTLDAVPRLSIPRLVHAFEKIASALVHMHRRGVYHADLKPNNILLSRTGDLKVIDFGLAWVRGEPKSRVQGTPEYMAPEQVKEQTANEQTDIYNFGATMYRLITWRLPPSAAQPGMSSKLFAQLLEPVASYTPSAPPELCDLIHRCLAYKPAHRPQRSMEVFEELQTLVKSIVTSPADGLDGFEW
jgi:serine/threonine protein kinase